MSIPRLAGRGRSRRRLPWRRLALIATAAAAAAAVTASGLHAPPARATAWPDAAALHWQDCGYAPGYQCANLTVPLDYASPAGPTVSVALIRHLAGDPAARGRSLVFNPGGPGGPGTVVLPLAYDQFPAAVRQQFTIVSFDPRGIGRSDGLRCFASEAAENSLLGPAADGFPVGQAQTLAWDHAWRTLDARCAQQGGAVLRHMSTPDVARDMDRIRQALGERELTYYGPSYGTLLGATYANLFPGQVGAMVLDGNVDPVAWANGSTPTGLRIAADAGSAAALREFLTTCGRATIKACAFSAGSPAATSAKYRTLLQRLRRRPVSAGSPSQSYSYATTVSAVRTFLYTTQPAPALEQPGWAGGARLLQELWQASGSAPAAPATAKPAAPSPAVSPAAATPAEAGPYQGIEQLLGVTCGESPNPGDMAAYVTQGQLAARRSGAFGPLWAAWSAGCVAWPGAGQSRYTGPWNRVTAHPLLVVGNTADPATAYSGSVAMAHDLARARLLTVDGSGHSALLNRSTCADGYITRYLLTGELPPGGTVCAPDTEPFAG